VIEYNYKTGFRHKVVKSRKKRIKEPDEYEIEERDVP
jgi:hypothetical protein